MTRRDSPPMGVPEDREEALRVLVDVCGIPNILISLAKVLREQGHTELALALVLDANVAHDQLSATRPISLHR